MCLPHKCLFGLFCLIIWIPYVILYNEQIMSASTDRTVWNSENFVSMLWSFTIIISEHINAAWIIYNNNNRAHIIKDNANIRLVIK